MVPTTDACCCCFTVGQGSFLIGLFLVAANIVNIIGLNVKSDFGYEDEAPPSDEEKLFLAHYKMALTVIAGVLIADGILISIAAATKWLKILMFSALIFFAGSTSVFLVNVLYYVLYTRFSRLLLDMVSYAFALYLFTVLWSYYKEKPEDEGDIEEEDVDEEKDKPGKNTKNKV